MTMKDDPRTPDPRNVPGEFCVLRDCCLLCGVPWHYAPELFGYDDNGCWVSRQPVGLIRFGGHLSKGEYDVQTDGRHTEATSASTVHR